MQSGDHSGNRAPAWTENSTLTPRNESTCLPRNLTQAFLALGGGFYVN